MYSLHSRETACGAVPKEATNKAEKIGDLIVSDVWGPTQIEGPACEKYFYSHMDVSARYSGIYFRNTKDEALKHFTTRGGDLYMRSGTRTTTRNPPKHPYY